MTYEPTYPAPAQCYALPDPTVPLRGMTGKDAAKVLGLSGPASDVFAKAFGDPRDVPPISVGLDALLGLFAYAGLAADVQNPGSADAVLVDIAGVTLADDAWPHIAYVLYLHTIQEDLNWALQPLRDHDFRSANTLAAGELKRRMPTFSWSVRATAHAILVTGQDKDGRTHEIYFDPVDPRRPDVTKATYLWVRKILQECGKARVVREPKVRISNWGNIELTPENLQALGTMYNTLQDAVKNLEVLERSRCS